MEPLVINGIAFTFWTIILVLVCTCMVIGVLIGLGWLLRILIEMYKPLTPRSVVRHVDINTAYPDAIRGAYQGGRVEPGPTDGVYWEVERARERNT